MEIGIVGATGYGGADLIRILRHHPETNRLHLYSSSQAGTDISESFPHLQLLQGETLHGMDPVKMGTSLDVVFLATPAGVSTELAPLLLAEGLRVIDLSGDFRIKDPEIYETWYKKKPAPEEWTSKAVYGLAEWEKELIRNADLLANPGCFPTATLLGLLPLVQHSLIEENSIIIDAKTGTSGAGRGLSQAVHFSETNENFKIYKVNSHQHTPEIEQELKKFSGKKSAITFSPHLVPMTRGIMATIYAGTKDHVSESKIRETYEKCYKDSPFVHVRKKGTYPATKEVYGSNQCHIGLDLDGRTGRLTVVSVIDNLMKGAAGQAVQNYNLMFGFDESAGLTFLPVYP